MDANAKTTDLNEVTVRRLERLRKLSFIELGGLPEVQEETERVGKHELKVTTYRDVLPDERLRIVVQVYLRRFLGGSITADGFIVGSDGDHKPVPEEMIWEFV
jgi:hypothetical protein